MLGESLKVDIRHVPKTKVRVKFSKENEWLILMLEILRQIIFDDYGDYRQKKKESLKERSVGVFEDMIVKY